MAAAKARQQDLEDQAIIRERVNTGLVPSSKTSVIKALAQKWIALTAAAQGGDSLHKAQDAYHAFCSLLASMELQARKLGGAIAANTAELQGYEDKQQQLEDDIAQARALIDDKKQQLAEARLWRKQQEEYEVLREQITKLPPRHETQQAIDQVNRDIASIQAGVRQQQHLNEVVGKKVAAVRYHVEDLMASFPTHESLQAAAEGGDAAQPMAVDS